jgi:hypothetical protein
VPYIPQSKRYGLAHEWDSPATAGELNYKFTQLSVDFLRKHGLSYHSINDVLGALEGAKLEFYRRVAIPYENGKIQENGDVYPVAFTTEK